VTRKGIVLVVAGSPWDGPPMSERQLALRLARHRPVLWVEPARSWAGALRDGGGAPPRLRRVAPGVSALSTLTVPGVSRPLLRGVAARQVRQAVRCVLRRHGLAVDATVVAAPEGDLRLVPTRHALLYVTDDWPAGARLMGIDSRWAVRALAAQLAEADSVVTVSPELRSALADRRPDAVVVPNGCDSARFGATDDAPLPVDVEAGDALAGFVGHLSERIDVGLLEAVADRGVRLLLVGPVRPSFRTARVAALLSRPRVHWVGAKPFEEIPSYLRAVRVGLTPYSGSAFNRGSFPLKTLEYLAAGRRVVSTDLPAARALGTDLVVTADGPGAFADAVVAALREAPEPQEVRARRAFAAGHDWSVRAAEFARLMDL
jgi:teichuronic acid biosynthesis glycosyltransferase TuaH